MISSEGGGSNNQDFDLNLAPIIDCFIVLITYLLISASFLSLTVLDVSIASTGGKAAEPTTGPTDIPLTVVLTLHIDHTFEFKISGGPQKISKTITVPNTGESWNVDELNQKMAAFKKEWPGFKEMSVNADPRLQYKDLVRIIEELKSTMPNIFLSS